jgi:hypothetical protein
MEEEEGFVMDQIVGHGADDDGNMLEKVRWFRLPFISRHMRTR